MFVDEILYESVKNFTFTSPCDGKAFEESSAIKSCGLYEIITFYIKYRGFHTNERMLPNSLKLNSFKVECYKSECCATVTSNEQQHFLVGDSAMGVPFYRSLRNGFMASNHLTNLIMGIIDEDHFFGKDYSMNCTRKNMEEINPSAYLIYDKYMSNFYIEELARAKVYTKGVTVKQYYSKLSNMLPEFMQISSINEKNRKAIEAISVPFCEDKTVKDSL